MRLTCDASYETEYSIFYTRLKRSSDILNLKNEGTLLKNSTQCITSVVKVGTPLVAIIDQKACTLLVRLYFLVRGEDDANRAHFCTLHLNTFKKLN